MCKKVNRQIYIKKGTGRWWAIIVVIVVLINSGYYRTMVTDSYVPLVMVIFLAIYSLFKKNNNKVKILSNRYLVVLLIGVLISTLANFSIQNMLSGGRVAAMALCAFILVNTVDFNKFKKTFTDSVKFLIVISAMLYLIVQLTGVLNVPKIGEYGEYYDLFFVTMWEGGSRTHGVFWEPGVFSSIIIFALIFDLYFAGKKVSGVSMTLYIIGITMTKSTAGILVLLIILLSYIWKITGFNRIPIFNIIFVLIVAFMTIFYKQVFFWLSNMNPEIFSKLIETTSITTSTRLNAPLLNMQIFMDKPLFGWGFTDSATQFAAKMWSRTGTHIVAQTSTSTQVMASLGITGVSYTLAFISPIFSKKKLPGLHFIDKIIIATCMLLIVNKEPHIYILITWMLMFYMTSHTNMAVSVATE